MKYFTRSCIIALAALLAACQSSPEMETAEISQDPAVAEAGWKVGQVYKTVKRGGVTCLGGNSYCLNDEIGDARVRKSWQVPNYEDKWFAYKVPPGSLFQVTTIEYGTGIGGYMVSGVHLPDNPLGTSILMDTFGQSDTIRSARGWWITARDANYLVPVETSAGQQPNSRPTKNTNE